MMSLRLDMPIPSCVQIICIQLGQEFLCCQPGSPFTPPSRSYHAPVCRVGCIYPLVKAFAADQAGSEEISFHHLATLGSEPSMSSGAVPPWITRRQRPAVNEISTRSTQRGHIDVDSPR
jgi:hypothetical protein